MSVVINEALMSYEIVKPTTVRVESLDMELQFYVSSDGKQVGVSQAALARMCGVGYGTINTLVGELSQQETVAKKTPESLKGITGTVLSSSLKGDAGSGILANIVNSGAAAEIIAYYAYESRSANASAKKSLKAFARVGIETWIKKLTGYDVSNGDVLNKMDELADMMKVLVHEVAEVKAELKDHKRIVTVYPVVDSWVDKLRALPSAEKEFTIKELLAAKGEMVTDSQYRRIRLRAAESYKALTGETPAKRHTQDKVTKKRTYELVYRFQDIPMIEGVISNA